MWQLKHFNIIETENHLLRLDYHQLWTSSGSSNFHLLKNHWNVHNKSFEYDFRNIFIWHIGVFLSCPLVSKIQLRPLRKLTSVHDLYSNSYSFQYLQTIGNMHIWNWMRSLLLLILPDYKITSLSSALECALATMRSLRNHEIEMNVLTKCVMRIGLEHCNR